MNKEWDLIITNQSKLLSLHLSEVWRYRDLLLMYVKRDVVTLYKQTILGPLWFLIQPLLTTIMFMCVFGGIAGISTDGVPQAVFYLGGLVGWNYFADCLTKCSETFNANQHIFGKVYFPRLVVPLSITISNLIKMGIQFALFLAVYLYYIVTGASFSPNGTLLLLPLLILMLAAIGLGLGMIISSLTTKYRDLRYLISFGVQLWMYISPVVYPLSSLDNSPRLQMLMRLNPMTAPIEVFRMATLGTGTVEVGNLIYSLIFTAAALALGVILFSRIEKTFMDTV